jgi:hypothetical protein
MVKELLVGDYALADDIFEAKAKELLGSSDDPRYGNELSQFVDFITKVTAVIPAWKEIAELPEGTPRNRITDFRNQGLVCLSATGLVLIGRVGHEIYKNRLPGWEQIVARLGSIDWRRSAAIWQGNIIQSNKVMTQRGPVREAYRAIQQEIGLGVPDLPLMEGQAHVA